MHQGNGGAADGMSVAEMVAAIALGSPAAERAFVVRYQRGVTVLVRRHCRPNDPDVPDLVQDVLAAVLERLRSGSLRDAEALAGYVQTSVVRMTASEYRRRARRDDLYAQAARESEPAEDDTVLRLDRHRRDRLVRELVGQLAQFRDREVLRRFYLEEESKEDVCTALGIEPGHFHRVVFRARQRLKELLEGAGIGSSIAGETTASLETPV